MTNDWVYGAYTKLHVSNESKHSYFVLHIMIMTNSESEQYTIEVLTRGFFSEAEKVFYSNFSLSCGSLQILK